MFCTGCKAKSKIFKLKFFLYTLEVADVLGIIF